MSLSHRQTGTRLYRIWKSMKTRCLNPNMKYYKNYGGRGICICDEWLNFEPFMKWALSSGYTDELTLDRIDNDGNYEPSNCRWITMKEQNQHRRNTIFLIFDGKTYTPTELSKLTGISVNTIYDARRNQHISDFTDYVRKRRGINERKYSKFT